MARDFMDAEGLSVRPIGADEADALRLLVAGVSAAMASPAEWAAPSGDGVDALLDASRSDALGLYDGDGLVGAAFLVRSGTSLQGDDQMERCGLPERGTAEIAHVMLDPGWRGEGLAADMVAELLRVAESTRGIRRVYALTHPRDVRAQKLFERSLFVSCCGVGTPAGDRVLYHRWFADRPGERAPRPGRG